MYILSWEHSWYRQAQKSAEPQPFGGWFSQAGLSQHYRWINSFQQFSLSWFFPALVFCIPTPPRTIWQPVYPQTPRHAQSLILTDATHAHTIMPVKCQAVTQTSRYFKHFEEIKAPSKPPKLSPMGTRVTPPGLSTDQGYVSRESRETQKGQASSLCMQVASHHLAWRLRIIHWRRCLSHWRWNLCHWPLLFPLQPCW